MVARARAIFTKHLILPPYGICRVVFLIENNGYGLSTPVNEQFRCKQLADRAVGYGMEGITIDGNDLEGVYRTVSRRAAVCVRCAPIVT